MITMTVTPCHYNRVQHSSVHGATLECIRRSIAGPLRCITHLQSWKQAQWSHTSQESANMCLHTHTHLGAHLYISQNTSTAVLHKRWNPGRCLWLQYVHSLVFVCVFVHACIRDAQLTERERPDTAVNYSSQTVLLKAAWTTTWLNPQDGWRG